MKNCPKYLKNLTPILNCLLTRPFIDPSFLSPFMDPSFLDPHSVVPFVDPFVDPFIDPFVDLLFFLTAFYRRKAFCENGNNWAIYCQFTVHWSFFFFSFSFPERFFVRELLSIAHWASQFTVHCWPFFLANNLFHTSLCVHELCFIWSFELISLYSASLFSNVSRLFIAFV